MPSLKYQTPNNIYERQEPNPQEKMEIEAAAYYTSFKNYDLMIKK